MRSVRPVLVVAGIGVVVLGLLLPDSWNHPLPSSEPIAAPSVSGWTLLRITLVLEGVALALLALRARRLHRIAAEDRLRVGVAPAGRTDRRHLVLLGLVVALGLALRLVRIDGDLWLDEIVSVQIVDAGSLWQILTSFPNTNNHVLNSVLVELSTDVLGQSSWAVRLPAVAFGTATLPVMYALARQYFPPSLALGGTLVLAVSYQHVYFSQSARGYAATVFCSALASLALVLALRDDRLRWWIVFVVASFGSVAAHLQAAFVVAAHGAVGAVVVIGIRRAGGARGPMARRLASAFAAIVALALLLYAAVIPVALAFLSAVYGDEAAGYRPFTAEFFRELTRGLSPGIGVAAVGLLIPALVVALVAIRSLARRNWPLLAALGLGPLVHGAYLVLRGYVVSPRFFILLVLPLILIAVEAIAILAGLLTRVVDRRRAPASGCLVGLAVLALVAAAPLRSYYRVPKQSYRASIAFVNGLRTHDQTVLVLGVAEQGYRYYAPGRLDTDSVVYVRALGPFERAVARAGANGTIAVTTFPRALRLSSPALDRRLREGWRVARTFPASVGDGEISVWTPRRPAG